MRPQDPRGSAGMAAIGRVPRREVHATAIRACRTGTAAPLRQRPRRRRRNTCCGTHERAVARRGTRERAIARSGRGTCGRQEEPFAVRHGGSGRRGRQGLGQQLEQGLPPSVRSLVRQDQERQLHVGSGRDRPGQSRGSRQGLQQVATSYESEDSSLPYFDRSHGAPPLVDVRVNFKPHTYIERSHEIEHLAFIGLRINAHHGLRRRPAPAAAGCLDRKGPSRLHLLIGQFRGEIGECGHRHGVFGRSLEACVSPGRPVRAERRGRLGGALGYVLADELQPHTGSVHIRFG